MVCEKLGTLNYYGTHYRAIKVTVGGKVFTATEATGDLPRIIFRNESWKLDFGKEFPSWDDACMAFNDPDAKVALLMAECAMRRFK